MSDQQTKSTATPQPNQKELISLITNPQIALCLVEFLKDLSRDNLAINNEGKTVKYERRAVLEALKGWVRLNLPDIPPEAFGQMERFELFNQITESIFRLFYEKKEGVGPPEERIKGAVVPEHLQQLVETFNAQQIKKPEGVNPKDLGKLSVKEMVRLATEIREKIKETAHPKFYPAFPEAVEEINEQVLKKAVSHYAETQKPPEAQVLKEIITEVIKKNPEASLIFAGKTVEKESRIAAVARGLEPIVQKPSIKQATNAYQQLREATDLQCTRTNLATTLQSWGLNPRQTLEFLNEIETHHPDMSLEELRKELKLFMRTQGLSPEQEKQITSHLRTFKRYLELSPSVSYEGNVFVASSSTKRTANWLGLSTSVLSAVGLGLTEERIDQELQRTDLSTAERNRLLALKANLREAQEKIKQKTKQDIADKKTGQYWKPGGFYFYRPSAPPVIERPTLTFFQILSSPASAIIKRSVLRGLGSLKFGKMPGLRRLGYFQPSTWKKKAKFWLAKRIVGGLLLASGKGLLEKLGTTIIKDGFRAAFFKGLAFVFKKAAAYAAQKMAQSVLWRMLAWLLGAVGAQLIPGIGQIVGVILLVAGVLDFVWSAFKFVKDLLGKKPKELLKGGFETSEAAAKVAAGPLSLLSLLKGVFRPKTYVEGEFVLETGLRSLSTAAVLSVIGVIFLFLIVFNPLTPAFVTLYTGYKAYQSIKNAPQEIQDFFKKLQEKFGTPVAEAAGEEKKELFQITAENADDVYQFIMDEMTDIPLEKRKEVALYLKGSAERYEDLQCVGFVKAMTKLIGDKNLESRNAIDYLEDPPPDGFKKPESWEELQENLVGAIGIVSPDNCPGGKTCEENINCCGHVYTYIAEGTIAQAIGKGTGEGGYVSIVEGVPIAALPLENYLIATKNE